MTLPASGTISMSQVASELGLANAGINLNHAWVRALAQKTSGVISLGDLHGKTARFDGSRLCYLFFDSGGYGLAIDINASWFGGSFGNPAGNESIVCPSGSVGFPVFVNFAPGAGPNWNGNIYVINNTTGIAIVFGKDTGIQWSAAAMPANFLRSGATDSFTILPSN